MLKFRYVRSFLDGLNISILNYINRMNAILGPLTKGRLQVFNKYQTEEQERLLYSEFLPQLRAATTRFVDLGLMTKARAMAIRCC